MNKLPIWFDTDCGIDDAIAILVALKCENLEVVGMSATHGNVELEKTFKNTRDVLALAGRSDIKVYKGADRPLMRQPMYAPFVHGDNGIGNIEIEASKAPVEQEAAWDALYKKAKELNGKLNVVTVGPLTNLAIAFTKYPDLKNYIEKISMMGGAAFVAGNHNMVAEFNIAVDAHAAEVVFRSGVHVDMYGLDCTCKTWMNQEHFNKINSVNTTITNFAHDIVQFPLNFFKDEGEHPGFVMHDSCPVLGLAYPELFKKEECGIYCETQGEISYGKTINDLYCNVKFKDRHCSVVLDLDREKVIEHISNKLMSY